MLGFGNTNTNTCRAPACSTARPLEDRLTTLNDLKKRKENGLDLLILLQGITEKE